MCRINLYQAVAESTAPWRSSSRSCRRTPWARNSTSHYVKRQRAWRSLKTYNFRMSRPSGLPPPPILRLTWSVFTPSRHHSSTAYLIPGLHRGGKTFTVDCQNLADIFIICHLPVYKTLIVFTQVHCLTKWSPCEMPSEQHVGRHLGQKVG